MSRPAVVTRFAALAWFGVAASVAAAEPLPAVTCAEAPPNQAATPTPRPRSLDEVDWCNHDFGGVNQDLRRGRAELHEYGELGGLHDTYITRLRAVVRGDLDGDRRPEVAVVLSQETWLASGGSNTSTDVLVFTWRRGKPHLLGAVPAGTPVEAVSLRRGLVEFTSGPDHTVSVHRRGKRGFVLVRRTTP